jgi:hypothetical protein
LGFRYEGTNWEGIEWRTVGAITTIGQQIEQIRPGPNTYPTDGTVASRLHDQTNPRSDHRPNGSGNVLAIDFGGPTGWIFDTCELIRLSQDPRVKYMIHNLRMFSSYAKPGYPPFTWRPYSGASPHRTHAHLSVVGDSRNEQTYPWTITEDDVPQFTEEEAEQLRKLVAGLESKDSSGWGFATQGVDLIRRERQLPLHEPETSGGDVLKRGDIVQLGNPASD